MVEQLITSRGDVARISTHIKGLDELIEGGIPSSHISLISGTPGTMKSSLALYNAYHEVIKNKSNTLIVSLDQSFSSIYNQFISLGFDVLKTSIVHLKDLSEFGKDISKIKVNDTGNIIIIDYECMNKEIKPVSGENKAWINIIKNLIKKIKQEVHLDIVVLDSLNSFHHLSKFSEPEIEIKKFFNLLKELSVHTILINEEIQADKFSPYNESILCESLIQIKLKDYERKTVRELTIKKMRHTSCSLDTHTLKFNKGRFYVEHSGQNPLI